MGGPFFSGGSPRVCLSALGADCMSTRIVLSTINARYSHASLGLRCLYANLGPLREQAEMLEFTLQTPVSDIVERILEAAPDVVGFGIYIWNIEQTTRVMAQLRVVAPHIVLVIGGPEVSYEYEGLEAFALADHLIPGEADLAFADLVGRRSRGDHPPKVISAPPPAPDVLALPYPFYTDHDIRTRLIYVEASRGCPFRCRFCLSALDIPLRSFPLPEFLDALKTLIKRGARAFKFVDRTFNLDTRTSTAILAFCLEHCPPGFELHFEMVPDRLPESLRALLKRFPPGMVQLEIGIQTFDPMVSKTISRPLKVPKIEDNLRFLREETGVHTHADLIVGLPGEDEATFGAGLDRLLALGPDEIQIGILKRLRGAPITRIEREWALDFNPYPPYEVLRTGALAFETLQKLKRFARYFDLYYNNGNFVETMALLFGLEASPYHAFSHFVDWLWGKTGQMHRFRLSRLGLELFTYLIDEGGCDAKRVAEALLRDWDRHGVRRERLEFLRPYVESVAPVGVPAPSRSGRRRRGRGGGAMGVEGPVEWSGGRSGLTGGR